MKVLVINLDKAIFEEGSASLERLKEYSRFLEKLFVIVWTKEKKTPIVFENKLFVYPTNSRTKFFYGFNSFFIAKKILKENKIDLLFTQDPFETGFCGWLIAKIFKLPLQFQIHTDFLSPYFWKESLMNKIRVLSAKFLIKRAYCLRVVSERIKKSLVANGYSPNSIAVLPIFVDVKKIQGTASAVNLHQKYPQFDFIILTASRLTREKNVGLAIKAMAEVFKKYPKTGLVIVGNGPERKNYSLPGNVILENAVPFEELISYYKTADLFLLTSNYEGYGMAVIEAMAAGLPVVMTDVGLAGEVLINGKEGLVAPVGDVKKLSEAIVSLMASRSLRKEMAFGALEKVKQLSTKEEYLKNYKNLLLNE
ncbi:MAG: Glycosyltransferase [Parcubacteria group bacterium GW2011_GWB1_41_6]|nr:MAG: Glycosyltransferase [Parcubacteria group bacterium GW2011_GWB1_41_6]KKS72100.1 MAG: Glycosyltransferase [Parcubacteria group bacterium GW2011_GWF2_42_7]